MSKFWKRDAIDIDVRPVPNKARVEIVLGVEVDELTASHEMTFLAMLFALPKSVRDEVRRRIKDAKKK